MTRSWEKVISKYLPYNKMSIGDPVPINLDAEYYRELTNLFADEWAYFKFVHSERASTYAAILPPDKSGNTPQILYLPPRFKYNALKFDSPLTSPTCQRMSKLPPNHYDFRDAPTSVKLPDSLDTLSISDLVVFIFLIASDPDRFGIFSESLPPLMGLASYYTPPLVDKIFRHHIDLVYAQFRKVTGFGDEGVRLATISIDSSLPAVAEYYNGFLLSQVLGLGDTFPRDHRDRMRDLVWHFPATLYQFGGGVDITGLFDRTEAAELVLLLGPWKAGNIEALIRLERSNLNLDIVQDGIIRISQVAKKIGVELDRDATIKCGATVQKVYRHHRGQSPPKTNLNVGGKMQPINAYTREDFDIIAEGIREFLEKGRFSRPYRRTKIPDHEVWDSSDDE